MTRLIEGDHIRRLRAFKFLRDQAPDKSHATPELLDVLALLAEQLTEAQVAFVARGMELRDAQARLAEALEARQRMEQKAAQDDADWIAARARLAHAEACLAEKHLRLAEAEALLRDETVGEPYWCERRDAFLSPDRAAMEGGE